MKFHRIQKKLILGFVLSFLVVPAPSPALPDISQLGPKLMTVSPLLLLAYKSLKLDENKYGKHLPVVGTAVVSMVGAWSVWNAYFRKHPWESNAKISQETKSLIKTQLTNWRLRENPQNRLDYFKWIAKYPFGKRVQPFNVDLEASRRQLDSTHFGLSTVKESIIDYLAGLWISKGRSAKVICFDGPPGTGKTTLAQSIAKALNKNFFAIKLADLTPDELFSEGDRWDPKGPGLLARALIDTKSLNPVVLLDELEKISKPEVLTALLAVLDPAQNNKIRDRYYGFDIDLSNVTFIVTVNDLAKLPEALKSRMQIIHLHAYSLSDRKFIARNMLVPQLAQEMNLSDDIKNRLFGLIDALAVKVMRMEGGMRAFKRCLQTAAEKYARQIIENEGKQLEEIPLRTVSFDEVIASINPELLSDTAQENTSVVALPGIVHGLQMRGQDGSGGLLTVESLVIPHGSGKLMKNLQADAACKQVQQRVFSYVKTIAAQYGIADDAFRKTDFIFGDQIQKDGDSSSLGLAYAVSLISALTKRPVRCGFALTGAIDMHGNVLPVDGYRDKILGSESPGITNIVVPASARPTMENIKESFPDMNIFYVNTVPEALELLLV